MGTMSAIERLEEQLAAAKARATRVRRDVDEAAQEVIGDGLTFASAYGAGYLDGAEYTTSILGVDSNTALGLGGYVLGHVIGGEAGFYTRKAAAGFVAASAAKMGREHGESSGSTS